VVFDEKSPFFGQIITKNAYLSKGLCILDYATTVLRFEPMAL